MAQTILIGYESSSGSFPNKDTGEVINFSNRLLKCITDTGADATHIGFDFFEEKVKMTDLARYLGVKSDDDSVDNTLKSLIHKPVEFSYAPRKGALAVVGFTAAKTDK